MFSLTGPVMTNAVGVAWRGDELDAESAHVENDGSEDVQVGLSRVVTAGAHLTQLERAAEDPEHLLLKRPGSSRLCPPRRIRPSRVLEASRWSWE